MQLYASDRLFKELNIVRRVRRLRSVGVLLKELNRFIESEKIIDTSKFYAIKEKIESSQSGTDSDSISSGEDRIIYKGAKRQNSILSSGRLTHNISHNNPNIDAVLKSAEPLEEAGFAINELVERTKREGNHERSESHLESILGTIENEEKTGPIRDSIYNKTLED